MSKAFDPLRRLVVQFNARLAHLRAFPTTNVPPPAPPHLHAPAPSAAHHPVQFTKPPPIFGQFQVKVAYPSHKDGPVLLAHLNNNFNSLVRQLLVPEPLRVAAVDYACRSAGRPQIASLLSNTSQRMMHHQPLSFATATVNVPHGFVKNVGFFSTRGFSSGVSAFHPAMNGPVKMMAQMYAKPLGSLPANAKKLAEKDNSHYNKYQPDAKKKLQRNKSHRGGEVKKRANNVSRISPLNIRAFMNRAATVEQQQQILAVCNVNEAITESTAISMAKTAGKTVSDLEELPKLITSDSCPTNVDMIFLLDASPLWHLDTMVAALHTDTLRAPKELNMSFIRDLLEVTNAQYQHFMEVSAILRKLVQCPETREITLEGYELRVHFVGTTLFDMSKFLQELTIDPKSPHFDLEEVFVDPAMTREQYYPQASVNNFYASSLTDNQTWDDCSSLHSSMMLCADSERCSSVVSFATMESLPEHQSPWEEVATTSVAASGQTSECTSSQEVLYQEQKEEKEHAEFIQDQVEAVNVAIAAPSLITEGLYPDEEAVSPWRNTEPIKTSQLSSSAAMMNLDRMSSQILNSTVVSEEYFDNIRGFLDSIEAVHRHSEKLFGNQ
ncbi:hypothetical protein BX616_000031 [Lobosporangium transversale]|uniref:Uncharacterized protein n=1 Tax=Lobosporangium transversale TaxID=64571 RepID=A0A1Y2GA05_9FUNG|nr:hypothetical protein BCR41DRAFT_362007 [Lobosporangium transversale]KAF9919178.1 hypothetical protein BX616_000031 [Lobosporangium transversale]ORZ05149.1 hypothetical protein BCR41DRAFT_362007 [Lobosporangium transversale]|eukprot:XP_021876924.1 hypothetical protein BCR41DRAFT_362007 [Lobosporangium transversale]